MHQVYRLSEVQGCCYSFIPSVDLDFCSSHACWQESITSIKICEGKLWEVRGQKLE